MNAKLNRLMKEERGITALETAIILIAFVVVAAIFAFTVLSTGTFLTEKSKEAAYAGLQEVRGSMELKGSMVLETSAAGMLAGPPADYGDLIVFNLANVAGGSSVDLSQVTILYRDTAAQNTLVRMSTGGTTNSFNCDNTDVEPIVAWEWCIVDSTLPTTDTDTTILKSGDVVKIKIYTGAAMVKNTTFAIEIKPPTGGTMLIERTSPAQITQVTDLH